jgi:hypothetical protein
VLHPDLIAGRHPSFSAQANWKRGAEAAGCTIDQIVEEIVR